MLEEMYGPFAPIKKVIIKRWLQNEVTGGFHCSYTTQDTSKM